MTETSSARLAALLEASRLLHSSLDLDALLSHLLRAVMGNLLVRRAALATAEGDRFRVVVSKGCPALSAGQVVDAGGMDAAGLGEIRPVGDPESPAGLLGIGLPASGQLTDEDRVFLDSLLGVAASALANARAHAEAARLNEELSRRVLDLTTLLDLGRGLTAALDPEEVAQMLGRTLSGQWAVRKYAVLAWKEGQPAVSRQRGLHLDGGDPLREAAEGLSGPALVPDLEEGPLKEALRAQGAAVVVPLRSAESAVGLVALGASAAKAPYGHADLDFIAGLAAQAVVALENAWNFRETLVKKNLERELSLAADIQRRLFPVSLPEIPGFELAARNRPAREVGGDTYDAIPVEGSDPPETLCCVADVSGKGIAASLLMSNFQATLRALLLSRPPMADLAAGMNRLVWATTPMTKYVTAFLLALAPSSGRVRWVNAGHNDGFVIRAGGAPERMRAGGKPIGLLPLGGYQERETTLEPGDVLFLYSDGVTEAQSPEEEELGDERLLRILTSARNSGLAAADVVDRVFEAVDDHAGAAPQYDDITAMALRRLP